MKKFLILICFISSFCFGQSRIGLNKVTSTLDADYYNVLLAAWADGINLPSYSCMVAQNQLMIDLKAAIGISSFASSTTDFDQIKILKHDGPSAFSDINWANPATKRTIQQHQVDYIPLTGFINTLSETKQLGGYESLNMGKLGPNFTLNSGEFITYYSDMSAGIYSDGGFLSTSSTNTSFNVTRTPTTVGLTINGSTTNANLSGFDLTNGLYFYGRTNSTTVFARKGSGSRVMGSSSSTSLWPYDYYVLAANRGDGSLYGPIGSGRKIVGFWASGRLLTTTEETSINTAWNNYLTSISALTAPTIGTIYNVSSWANLNDFTKNGCTASIVSNQINLTGGSNTFTQTLDLSSISGTAIGATKLSRWTQTIQFIVPTISGTNWLGVGIRSSNANANYYHLILRMDFTTASKGQMKLYGGTTTTLLRTSSALTINEGDVVSMTLNLAEGYVTYSCFNVTTSSAVITDAYTLYGISGGVITNTGHFAIFDGGGSVNTNKVTSWTISSGVYKGGYCFIGDSKTQGYQSYGTSSPNSILSSYTYLLQKKIGRIANVGGASDRTADYLTRTYEIVNWIQPHTVIIAGVCNDIRAGVSNATWQANVLSLISAFQAAGIRVIFWTGFKENYPSGYGTVDQTAVSTWANAGIGCDVWDSAPNNYDLNDNIHESTIGHTKIAGDAISFGKLNK